jgi:hypothetical protein
MFWTAINCTYTIWIDSRKTFLSLLYIAMLILLSPVTRFWYSIHWWYFCTNALGESANSIMIEPIVFG